MKKKTHQTFKKEWIVLAIESGVALTNSLTGFYEF
jgi:hypothetical protein